MENRFIFWFYLLFLVGSAVLCSNRSWSSSSLSNIYATKITVKMFSSESILLFHEKWIEMKHTVWLNVFSVQKCEWYARSVYAVRAPWRSSYHVETAKNIDAVRDMIRTDRHVTSDEINSALSLSEKTITEKHGHSGVRKLCCRWIPRNLTEAHKKGRVKRFEKMLKKFCV